MDQIWTVEVMTSVRDSAFRKLCVPGVVREELKEDRKNGFKEATEDLLEDWKEENGMKVSTEKRGQRVCALLERRYIIPHCSQNKDGSFDSPPPSTTILHI